MATGPTATRGRRWVLAGDGFLMTLGSFGLLTALGLLLWSSGLVPVLGESPQGVLGWLLSLVAYVLGVGGLIAGPLLAWRLHSGRAHGPAMIGALFGMTAGVLAVFVLVLLTAPVGVVVSLLGPRVEAALGGSEVAGPVVSLALYALLAVVAVIWLDVAAVRDLLPSHREHRALDTARLLATAAILVFAAAVTAVQVANPETGAAEAGIFGVAAGVIGAFSVVGADMLTTYAERHPPADVEPES